jgi:serine/threonine protein kinase
MLRLKLQICIMMALGVAHMHGIDGPDNATMVHYDINPKNVAIVKGGKPKLNDFNTVEFLRWDRVRQRRCGFRGRLHEPWWRAPEELIVPRDYAEGRNISADAVVEAFEDQPLLDEKIDVWSLGNLIYNMLTGHAARGQAKAWRYAEVRRDVLAAKMPWRPTDAMYLNSTQPAIVAMKRAVERCIVKSPRKRWSALDVANEMMDALDKILEDTDGKETDEESTHNEHKRHLKSTSTHTEHKRRPKLT